MEGIDLSVEAGWVMGLVLSMTRVAGFVIASPMLGRVLPLPARLAVTLALGLFLAEAPQVAPTLPFLLAAAGVNAAIGVALGYLSGLLMHLFPVAGSLIDMTSGLAAAATLDPTRGEQGAVFSRAFNMVGLAMFYAVGGLAILVRGLDMSVRAIPLDGAFSPSGGLLGVAAEGTGALFLAGVELALPVLAALFLTELVLGVASRFAPQANVLMVGLPAKLFVAFSMTSLSLLLFPETMEGVRRAVGQAMTDTLRGLTG